MQITKWVSVGNMACGGYTNTSGKKSCKLAFWYKKSLVKEREMLELRAIRSGLRKSRILRTRLVNLTMWPAVLNSSF